MRSAAPGDSESIPQSKTDKAQPRHTLAAEPSLLVLRPPVDERNGDDGPHYPEIERRN